MTILEEPFVDTPQQLPLNQFVLQLRHIVHCNQNFMDQVHIFESTYLCKRKAQVNRGPSAFLQSADDSDNSFFDTSKVVTCQHFFC